MSNLFGEENGVCTSCGMACRVEPASYGLQAYTCASCGAFGLYGGANTQGEPISAENRLQSENGRERAKQALQTAIDRQSAPSKKTKQGVLCQPGRRFKEIPVLEEAVQAGSIRLLRARGYLVEQTTVRFKRQRCPNCNAVHQYKPVDGGGYGSSLGISDLLVRHPSWPPGVWLQEEQKGTQTAVSPEQKSKHERGDMFICRSPEETLAAAESITALFAQFAALQR